VREQLGLHLGDRSHLGGGATELAEEVRKVGLRCGQVRHHRRQVDEERVQPLDRRVDRRPAAGERVAEALRGHASRRSGVAVERRQHVLDLQRLGRVAQLDRRPGPELAVALAGDQLDVLEAERRARAHPQLGVGGKRLDGLVELHVDTGRRRLLAAHGLDGRPDLVDHADAEAADAHLVALHELGARRQLCLDVVGRHEGQAGVGVVGQEHGHDRHQQGHRPDEHGAGGDGGCRAAAHGASR
jgi:hypothetical protein